MVEIIFRMVDLGGYTICVFILEYKASYLSKEVVVIVKHASAVIICI